MKQQDRNLEIPVLFFYVCVPPGHSSEASIAAEWVHGNGSRVASAKTQIKSGGVEKVKLISKEEGCFSQ
jgi:hypothetical protein